MASSEEFTKYIVEQLSAAGTITYKKFLCRLAVATCKALPAPKAKRKER